MGALFVKQGQSVFTNASRAVLSSSPRLKDELNMVRHPFTMGWNWRISYALVGCTGALALRGPGEKGTKRCLLISFQAIFRKIDNYPHPKQNTCLQKDQHLPLKMRAGVSCDKTSPVISLIS